jgi:hypothetical protein
MTPTQLTVLLLLVVAICLAAIYAAGFVLVLVVAIVGSVLAHLFGIEVPPPTG